MSKVIPIINDNNKKKIIIESNLPIVITNENNIENKITPVININNPNLSLQESDIQILSQNKTNQPIPVIDEQENLVIEVGTQGPPGPVGPPGLTGPEGPIGLTGNGIERIEKTSTSGIIDIYTIYFTNGTTFEYQITNGVVHYYDGEYEVTPMPFTSQILPTVNTVMRDNLNVHEIPYYEVSNLSGGITATIGDIN